MTDTLNDRVRALLELETKATPGPWHFDLHKGWAYPYVSVRDDAQERDPDARSKDIIRPIGADPGQITCTRGKLELEIANAELIAAARNVVRELAESWLAQRELLERVLDYDIEHPINARCAMMEQPGGPYGPVPCSCGVQTLVDDIDRHLGER